MVDYYGKIGKELKTLRLKKHMSRRVLAEGVCSVSYIARIENGERCPTSVILRQITNKLGITPEELLRAIESPSALKVKSLLDELIQCGERSDYITISKLIDEQEKHLEVESIHDLQIINALKFFTNAFLEEEYEEGIETLKASLYLTFNDENCPTDVELALISFIALLMILNGKIYEAYEYLVKFEMCTPSINCLHSRALIPRYYVILSLASLDAGSDSETFGYVEHAIAYCKKNNIHSCLRELFLFKSECYLKSGDEKNYQIWFDKAIILHDLIKNSSNDFFERLLESRKEIHELLKQQN